jgi:WXG100 family type VII secretion target
MDSLNTDTAILAKEAMNFERISAELKGVISQVEGTAGALASQWQGQAGVAAQTALARFHEAADLQIQELNEISGNIHTSGVTYVTADDHHTGALQHAMGIIPSPGPSTA